MRRLCDRPKSGHDHRVCPRRSRRLASAEVLHPLIIPVALPKRALIWAVRDRRFLRQLASAPRPDPAPISPGTTEQTGRLGTYRSAVSTAENCLSAFASSSERQGELASIATGG